jgi:hypothetical protein
MPGAIRPTALLASFTYQTCAQGGGATEMLVAAGRPEGIATGLGQEVDSRYVLNSLEGTAE